MKLKFLASIFFVWVFAFWPLTIARADSNGLKMEVYTFDPSSTPDRRAYELCANAEVSAPNLDADWADGIVAGCQSDYVLIHYSGYITSPRDGLVSFQSYADDGFWMSFNDVPVIDDWFLKGCSGSNAVVGMDAYQSYKFDAWWYEYGGVACNRLFWWNENGQEIVPPSAFSQDISTPPVIVTPSLNRPFLLEGVVDGTSVDLTWSSYIEETPIERYAIFWTYGGADGWGIASIESQVTITDLPENTEVTFKIRADNDSLGVYSDYSEPLILVTGSNSITPKPEPTVIPEPPVIPEPEPVEPETPQIDPVSPPEPEITPAPEPIPEPSPEPSQMPSDEDLGTVIPEMPTPPETRQQVLDALMAEAQADDIQIPAEIANIPVFGATIVALTDALNFMGNVGADMTPEVRAKAEKELVAAVVLTQITQFSTNQAVASAQASAGANGSSTRRRN